MIPEREREALMRLTMCAREECSMCKYQGDCNFDFQYELATKNMNILAEALRKTENSSEKPNNCDTCIHNKLEWYSEVCDGCSKAHSNYEPKDEPQRIHSCSECKDKDECIDAHTEISQYCGAQTERSE